MKYSLRSLLIVAMIAPPLLAGAYFLFRLVGWELVPDAGLFACCVFLSGLVPYCAYRLWWLRRWPKN